MGYLKGLEIMSIHKQELISAFVESLNKISRELTIDRYTGSEQVRLNTIWRVNKEKKKWEEKLK